MKNFLSLIIVVAMLCSAVSLISCSGGNSGTTEQTSTIGQTTSSAASSQTETTTKAETTASETTTSAETTPAETTTTAKPIIEKPPVLPEGKTLKVLAIGNSFSVDGMEYIYGIAKSAGYTNIVLGNLYIGGCSLSKHESNAKNNAPAYEFFTNTDGKWVSNKSTTIATGLAYTDWDCISIQQVSGYSGLAGSFEPSLTNLISYVKKACPNAKLVWHMTWAYQSNSGHSDFPKYGRDQLKMYNAITSATQKGILEAHKDDFAGVIPSGTAIQNLRTSFFGDTLTRDGYHLSYGIGRYTAALAWFKALTGADLDSVTYIPTEYGYTLGEKAILAAKEAVNYACSYPFEISESTYVNDTNKAQKEADLTKLGLDPDKYISLELDIVPYGYYNSRTGDSMISRLGGSTADNIDQFAASRIISKKDLPIGSIIVLDEGYQYRPDAWTAYGSRTPTFKRPAETTESVVHVTARWWNDFGICAFNVSKAGNPALSDEEMQKLSGVIRVYVPKPEKPVEVNPDDIDFSKYTKLDLGITYYAYYNSTSANPGKLYSKAAGDTQANLSQFAATKIFSKDELPIGSVIVIKEGYQYRPDGWTALNTKTGTRPANVTESAVKVDDNWWGEFNYRAFNIAKMGNPSLSDSEMKALSDVLTIYVPNK